ncbi:MAG: hypothetical protein M1816_001585 [Peltula sp. TS41687]|nr:MAG: hypothetical protein M1816_001585 [Peltula sp. TS41687]
MATVSNGDCTISHAKWPSPHLDLAHTTWKRLQDLKSGKPLKINGNNLDIAAVVAVSKHGCLPDIDRSPEVLQAIEASVTTLREFLDKGLDLYGMLLVHCMMLLAWLIILDMYGLQRALMQSMHSAVIVGVDKSNENSGHQDLAAHSMPLAWTKGSMILRCNANIRGASAMRFHVMETIVELLRHDLTPLVPLRGSVSASGDLMPLAYIAGAIQGNPDVFVRTGKKNGYRVVTAAEALKTAGIKPVVLGPKEGLSMINGTGASAAVASLALYEAHQLAVLSQLLTCMTAEALGSNTEWAHPFIAQARPHPGQIETAQNIRTFLDGSRLTYGLADSVDRLKPGLAQPRYTLRSSPQWIGPQLEDLTFSHMQLTTELNSTSDNPLIDVEAGDVHCGANFQAASVTMVAEKTRLGLQMLGKLLFSQCTEMINPIFSDGLPVNLAADDPSLSFCLKGVDINMAAYQSELAYLANPVSNHVNSAEMHNQAVNSLALLSSRYTMQAIEVVSLMTAATLYTACQAVDLRVMHRTFLEQFNPIALTITTEVLGDYLSHQEVTALHTNVWKLIVESWHGTGSLDAHERCEQAASAPISFLVDRLDAAPAHAGGNSLLHRWKMQVQDKMLSTYLSRRDSFFQNQPTARYLGRGSRMMYRFVREELGVPFHQGLIEHPDPSGQQNNRLDGREKKTIGSWITFIYEALCQGRLYDRVMEFVGGEVEVNGMNGA